MVRKTPHYSRALRAGNAVLVGGISPGMREQSKRFEMKWEVSAESKDEKAVSFELP